MLRVDDSWEIFEGLAIYRNLLGRPGLRRYSSCEIPINAFIFIVDFVLLDELTDGCRIRRIFANISELLRFLSCEKFFQLEINVLSQRSQKWKYSLRQVKTIFEGTDPEGQKAHMYLCTGNRMLLDTFSKRLKTTEIREKKIVWQSEH